MQAWAHTESSMLRASSDLEWATSGHEADVELYLPPARHDLPLAAEGAGGRNKQVPRNGLPWSRQTTAISSAVHHVVGVVGLSVALEQKPLLSVLLVRGIMAMFLTNKKQVPIPNESTQIRFQNDDLHRVLVSSGNYLFFGRQSRKKQVPDDTSTRWKSSFWKRNLGATIGYGYLFFVSQFLAITTRLPTAYTQRLPMQTPSSE